MHHRFLWVEILHDKKYILREIKRNLVASTPPSETTVQFWSIKSDRSQIFNWASIYSTYYAHSQMHWRLQSFIKKLFVKRADFRQIYVQQPLSHAKHGVLWTGLWCWGWGLWGCLKIVAERKSVVFNFSVSLLVQRLRSHGIRFKIRDSARL